MSNINLLPKRIKDDLAQSKTNKKILIQLLKSFFWIVTIIVIMIICWIYYNTQLNGIKTLVNRKKESIKQYSTIESEFNELSKRLATIKNIENNLYSWPGIINEVQNSMPNGATLTSLRIDSQETSRCELTGIAKTKSTVASLRNLLEKSKRFEYVNIEKSVTSMVQYIPEEIEIFTLTFSLSKGALNE